MRKLAITTAVLAVLSACTSHEQDFNSMSKEQQDKLIEERFREKYPENYEE
jgi:hypothetical protein